MLSDKEKELPEGNSDYELPESTSQESEDAQSQVKPGSSAKEDSEISEENNVIYGDQTAEEDEPKSFFKGKENYVLILAVIIVLILCCFWAVKGCSKSADNIQQNQTESEVIIIQ